jgi:hypothetical protein
MTTENTMTEKEIQQRVFNRLNSRRDVRVFRNNIGMGFAGIEFVNKEELIKILQYLLSLLILTPSNIISNVFRKAGVIILKNPRRIRFGLHPGSGDLIGWKSITITSEMVGKKIAVITSIEVKSARGRLSDEQKNWIAQVTTAGGIARMVKTVDEADDI